MSLTRSNNHPPCTIQDVARALGINKSTVSQALSGKGTLSQATRTRVLSVAREMGYRPNPLAQRLAHRQSGNMVCIVTGMLDIGLGTSKVLRVQNELAARSLEVPIYTQAGPPGERGESLAAQVQHLCRQRPRAIVCAGSLLPPGVFAELEAYRRDGGIVVSFDMPVPLACDQVVFDREDNAYRAAKHLLEQGHTRVGLGISRIPEGVPEGCELSQAIRLRGFRRALEESGVAFRDDWVFFNGAYEEGGEDMARRFLALEDRPTGLCVVNDYVALAFMSEVMRAGVTVPETLSIVSHDDQPIARHCPVPLTSVSHPVEKITQAAISLLTERLDGYDGPPRTITVRGDLVPRRSVAPPPPSAPDGGTRFEGETDEPTLPSRPG